MFRNSRGTVIRIDPRPMVLESVHGNTGPPQLVTVSVQVPATAPVALVGVIEATNCLTEFGAAPLMFGAASSAPIRSRDEAARTSLPRLESNGLSTDMSSPWIGVEKR